MWFVKNNMATYFRSTTIIKVKKLGKEDLNGDLKWLSTSLGMFSPRDKEKSCFRVFIELLKALKEGKELSSDKIAENTNLSRGTVIHHINRLMGQGIIKVKDNKYALKYDSLSSLVDQLEDNVLTVFKDIKDTAKKIDKAIGLKED